MSSLKEDIEEFMGVPYDEVVKNVVNAKDENEYLKNLWDDMIPTEVTRKNIWEYYSSDQYAAFLFWQAVQKQDKPAMPQLLANVMDMHFTQPRILDFGCGDGMIDLGLKSMGFDNITLADIPQRYNRFLKFISGKYGLGFKFIPVDILNEYPLDQKYDVIICTEVLEHVWDLEITLLHLTEHLEQLGYMYIPITLSDPGDHYKLNVFQDVEKWYKTVEGNGLKRKFQDENGVWVVWQKV